ITASRMDGAFGLASTSWREPIDGGLAGLAKTVRQEWPTVHAKAIDLGRDFSATEAAAVLIEEASLVGPPEVGLSPAGRMAPGRLTQASPGTTRLPIQPGEVVLVSGGARGVTAECAVALAKAYRLTLVLLGRSPEPGKPDDLETVTDPAALKRELSKRRP